jgi:thiosulfate/3-mercaptopyruvate sulfurtransferase
VTDVRIGGVSDPYIGAEELAEALPNVTVLDARWRLIGAPGRDDYEAGHLPGAVFVDVDSDMCGPPGAGGRHPLPDPDRLQQTLRRAGVQEAKEVVVYDGGDSLGAARTWWTLKWAGHPRVRVLRGGFPAWNGPVTTEEPAPEPGDFTVRTGGLPTLAAEDVVSFAGQGLLLDVRTPERFRGEQEPIDTVAGHIPGAVNAPGELPEIPADQEVGAYCGSGITAARSVLQLHERGRTDAKLYVGSWSGWITDPARPIATGE